MDVAVWWYDGSRRIEGNMDEISMMSVMDCCGCWRFLKYGREKNTLVGAKGCLLHSHARFVLWIIPTEWSDFFWKENYMPSAKSQITIGEDDKVVVVSQPQRAVLAHENWIKCISSVGRIVRSNSTLQDEIYLMQAYWKHTLWVHYEPYPVHFLFWLPSHILLSSQKG